MRRKILGLAGTIGISFAFTFISWTSSTEASPAKVVDSTELVSIKTVEKEATAASRYDAYLQEVYDIAQLAETGLNLSVFHKAVTGFLNLKESGKLAADKSILTIADFDQNSTKKRLWIVDLANKKLLLNTWVAHGQGSGFDKAVNFSDRNSSHQSSLGFYVTGEVYFGKHGRSLRLDGMDAGFNGNARSRAIVVHGADYVSAGTIKALGRLGRSHGCPAVAPELSNKVINTIAGKTVLFINSSGHNYSSKYLNEEAAWSAFAS